MPAITLSENMKFISLTASCIIYSIAFFIIFPYNKFNLDADGIAYIQQAKQYALGNYAVALNGCWSPLIAWLLVPFIKLCVNPVLCCKYINGILGLACIFSTYKLSVKFMISEQYRIILMPFCSLIFLSYAFHLLGPDLLQLLLLLFYLNFIFNKTLINSNPNLIFVGFIGALCYYAKAYNFFFFIIHISLVIFLYSKYYYPNNYKNIFIRKLVLVLSVFLICTAPYITLLSNKYQKFTISTASAITLNKSLEPDFSDGRKLIVPPKDINALSIADDPTFFQYKYISPFTSLHYFFKQIKITLANFIEYSKLLNEISFLGIAIILGFVIYLNKNIFRNIAITNNLLLFTLLIYPLGYILIAIEWRYIWIIPILLLLMSGVLLNTFIDKLKIKTTLIISILICLSFSVKPIMELKAVNNLVEVNAIAKTLKENNITGNFITSYNGWKTTSKSYEIAYLNDSKYFGLFSNKYTSNEIFDGAKFYNIKYFFYFYDSDFEKYNILKSELSMRSIQHFDNLYPGIIIFQLN